MTDYAKWKVVDLKAELKRRGIPQTGLKVKQNFIDKLLEADNAAAGSEDAEEGAAPEQGIEQETAEPKQAPIVEQDNANIEQQSQAPPEPEPVKSPEGERQAEFWEAPRRGVRDSAASEGKETRETHPDQTAPQQPQETPEQVTGQQAPEDAKEQLQERMDIERPQEESAAPATTNKQSPSTEQPSSATGEEAVDDMRKRKRRSPSPQPALDPIVQKKVKGEDGGPRVLLKEDVGVDNLPQRVVSDAGDVAMKEATTSEHMGEVRESKERAPEAANDEAKKTAHLSSEHDAEIQRDQVSHTKREREHEESPSRDVLKDGDEGRIVEPALHPATPALYIRNFMRPLQPANLKNYLISLATPPTKSPDPDTILDFFLDSIKTHCFVSFANISAASRVRSSLHGTVWPNERDRKPLWVDFIPEEKTRQWISIEQDSEGRGRGGPRWEVVYEETRNGIDAILQEAPSLTAAPSVPKAPLGPRGGFVDRDPRRGPPASADPRARGEGFKALDELFKSTTAKPKLYYLPVPKEVAARRLDKFDELARKGPYPRPGGDETRRITFENTDSFVDQGPEYAVRRRGGRGRGGGYGGPWRDSWRGRGR